ncbi:MAG TPA: hydrogenase 2 operon protein HybA [Vicinamibacterales bacterium]|jgi:Fe-S-cluster-containing dehydrogenase component|nr:hydrogenase 2 operon protein HybA [Vicinamibacterales bacterium]
MKRRTAFKVAFASVAAAVGTAAKPLSASVPLAAPADAVGLLYDTTKCIGCKACVVACREANGLEPDTSWSGGLYQAPLDLNEKTKTVIKLYDDGEHRSFVKAQCMHCIDPACASACMLGAFKKREFGIVTYDVNYCIGCRYCEVACPYGVPKFQWSKAAPKMVKCELCNHRLAQGKVPACAEVCPRQAVIFGKRDELLAEAKRRIAENPGKYVQKVYGETDGGGTQCLYVSHVPFEQIGLPALSEQSTPTLQRTIQHSIYRGFAAPVALYGLLGMVMLRNRKSGEGQA